MLMMSRFICSALFLVVLGAGTAGARDAAHSGAPGKALPGHHPPLAMPVVVMPPVAMPVGAALHLRTAHLPQDGPTHADARHLLDLVEKSISENDLKPLQPFFSSKVYISLLNGQEGYFSAEQSFFILKSFFISYTPISFSYSNSSVKSSDPYGVGTLQYLSRGQRGKAQLYVSLTRTNDAWRIGQITITNR